MQTKLAVLRSRLNSLRRKRAAVRWCSAICAPAAATLWLLVAAFVCDWSFNLPRGPRGLVLIAWFAGGIWAIKKFAWPLLIVRESTEDIALIVERQNGIDSDLVAALQFESPAAKKWGSSRLTQAVVDYVAEFSPSLDVNEGFSFEPLPRRAMAFVITLLPVIGISVAFPDHAAAFWNRFLLGSAHYPTKTQIESILVSGHSVPVYSTETTPTIRIPYGQPITIEVKCAGEVPLSGAARLSGVNTDSSNRLELQPLSGSPSKFVGEVTHVADSFRIRFQFGDAISDATEVAIVPLPLVDIAWEVTPPRYAIPSLKSSEFDGGSRQQAVLEGSSAQLKLSCSNKRLASVRLNTGTQTLDLISSSPSQLTAATWSLPASSPFESIHEAIKYEIQVVDEDGLSLETPITGQFRLKTDRLPRIVASAVTRQVLPTAQPKLDYAAGDDFGVARIVARIQISRENGQTSRHEVVAKVIPDQQQPLTMSRGQIAIPLSPYELSKGDEVKVVLEVTDWRGELVGRSGSGEAITFSVTDLNGILAQTGEEDKKSAKQLDEILRRELGVGSEKN